MKTKKRNTIFEVEEIVDDKVEKGVHLFMVKWRKFPASQNTWEPITSFEDPDEIFKHYKRKIK